MLLCCLFTLKFRLSETYFYFTFSQKREKIFTLLTSWSIEEEEDEKGMPSSSFSSSWGACTPYVMRILLLESPVVVAAVVLFFSCNQSANWLLFSTTRQSSLFPFLPLYLLFESGRSMILRKNEGEKGNKRSAGKPQRQRESFLFDFSFLFLPDFVARTKTCLSPFFFLAIPCRRRCRASLFD